MNFLCTELANNLRRKLPTTTTTEFFGSVEMGEKNKNKNKHDSLCTI
jgi:hypothetical protein